MPDNNDVRIHEQTRPRKGVLTTVIFILIFAAVLFYLVRSMASQWDVIRDYPWRFNFSWLACSAALLWVVSLSLVQLWRYLLFSISGQRLKFWTAFRITVLSNLGKYLPGKVWSMMGMFYMLNREGYSTATAFVGTVLHQAFTLIAGALFVTAVLGHTIFQGLSILPLVLGVVLAVIILYPGIFARILNCGLRLFKRPPVVIQLSFGRSLVLLVFYVISWVLYGASFWCMLHGLGFQPDSFWAIAAGFGAAYLLGYLAIFAPGGLGVREGVLSVLLASTMSPGLAAMIAVAARLWMTLIEASQLLPLVFAKGKNFGRERH